MAVMIEVLPPPSPDCARRRHEGVVVIDIRVGHDDEGMANEAAPSRCGTNRDSRSTT